MPSGQAALSQEFLTSLPLLHHPRGSAVLDCPHYASFRGYPTVRFKLRSEEGILNGSVPRRLCFQRRVVVTDYC